MKCCNVKKIIGFVFFGTLAFIGFGYLFMALWNWLVPLLFNGPIITYWQGLGLIALSKIFFGKPGGRGRCCCKGGKSISWKNRWREKFEKMSDSEKSEFKNRMKAKFCNTSREENTNAVCE